MLAQEVFELLPLIGLCRDDKEMIKVKNMLKPMKNKWFTEKERTEVFPGYMP